MPTIDEQRIRLPRINFLNERWILQSQEMFRSGPLGNVGHELEGIPIQQGDIPLQGSLKALIEYGAFGDLRPSVEDS